MTKKIESSKPKTYDLASVKSQIHTNENDEGHDAKNSSQTNQHMASFKNLLQEADLMQFNKVDPNLDEFHKSQVQPSKLANPVQNHSQTYYRLVINDSLIILAAKLTCLIYFFICFKYLLFWFIPLFIAQIVCLLYFIINVKKRCGQCGRDDINEHHLYAMTVQVSLMFVVFVCCLIFVVLIFPDHE